MNELIGVLLGLLFAIGVLMIWLGATHPRSKYWRHVTGSFAKSTDPTKKLRLIIGSISLAAMVAIVAFIVSQSTVVSLAFFAATVALPRVVFRHQVHRRKAEIRALWPEVVDNLASAVRAGLSLPEALIHLGVRGPEPLRESFRRFGFDYRASGKFSTSLDRLKAELADPTADRIVEAIRLAREVGGTDLGRLLRVLSASIREDMRIRGELEARQSWTINGARLAAAAPWVVLGMLATKPQAAAAYDSQGGIAVLFVGGASTFGAYRLMRYIGKLPGETRLLR
jgi:tight adherence protein B